MPPDPQWRDIGWNGITMQVPSCWQPKIILASYLLFECEEQPVFEIKWQQSRGRHAVNRILASIKKQLIADDDFGPWDIPAELREKLTTFSVTGFCVTRAGQQHFGMILYCPSCSRTSLLQFHEHPMNTPHSIGRLLASLGDHPAGNLLPWTIFDISARLPVQAALTSHEFLPGRFILRFRLERADIFLYRFKPAGILLKNSSLSAWGTSLASCGEVVEEGSDSVTWQHTSSGAARLTAWLRRRPAWCWMRLRHLQEHNAILGVRAEGRSICDRSVLESISADFHALDPQ